MERKEKFTPGPWAQGTAIYAGDVKVCLVLFIGSERVGEEIANSYLIAAAPDLYEVLSDTVQFIGWDNAPESRIERILDRIESALAKARGEA